MIKFFSQRQIDEIAKRLAERGVRDSDFQLAEALTGDELVAIVQKGSNRIVTLKDLADAIEHGFDPVPPSEDFNVSGGPIVIPAAGGSANRRSLTITTELQWTVTTKLRSGSVIPGVVIYCNGHVVTGAITGNAVIEIEAPANTVEAQVLGSVVFTYTNSTGEHMSLVSYTQEAYQPGPEPPVPPTPEEHISFSPTSISLESAAGSTDVAIYAENTGWRVTSKPEWVTLSAESGDASQTITITVDTYWGLSTRAGNIVFEADSGDEFTLAVTQFAHAATISASKLTSFSGIAGGSDLVQITGNVAWQATCSSPWVELVETSGGTDGVYGTDNLNFSVDGDITLEQARTATITVSSAAIANPVVITITQDAASYTYAIESGIQGYSFSAAGGSWAPTVVGVTYINGEIYDRKTLSVSDGLTLVKGSGDSQSRLSHTGITISAIDLGTTEYAALSGITYTAYWNGATGTFTVSQQANTSAISGSTESYSASVSVGQYTVSGTSIASASGDSAPINSSGSKVTTYTLTWSSGHTSTSVISEVWSGYTLSLSDDNVGASIAGGRITWATRGTTEGALSSVYVIASYNDYELARSTTTSQQANSYSTSTVVTDAVTLSISDFTSSSDPASAAGETADITSSGTRTTAVTYNYTSGASAPQTPTTESLTSSQLTLSGIGTGMNVSDDKVVWSDRGGNEGPARSGVVTLTSTYGGAVPSGVTYTPASQSVTVYQEANSIEDTDFELLLYPTQAPVLPLSPDGHSIYMIAIWRYLYTWTSGSETQGEDTDAISSVTVTPNTIGAISIADHELLVYQYSGYTTRYGAAVMSVTVGGVTKTARYEFSQAGNVAPVTATLTPVAEHMTASHVAFTARIETTDPNITELSYDNGLSPYISLSSSDDQEDINVSTGPITLVDGRYDSVELGTQEGGISGLDWNNLTATLEAKTNAGDYFSIEATLVPMS